jgi:twitching motility protein PilT
MEPQDRLFAEIAERLELLTPEQLARCDAHASRAAGTRLGEAAVALGFMTSDEVGLVRLQEQRAAARVSKGAEPRAAAAPAAAAPAPAPKPRRVQAWQSGDDPARDVVRLALEPRRASHESQTTVPLTPEEKADARAMFPALTPSATGQAPHAPKRADLPDAFGLADGEQALSLSNLPPSAVAKAKASAGADTSALAALNSPARTAIGAPAPAAPLEEIAIQTARVPSIPVPARASLAPEPVLQRPAAYNPSSTTFLGRALKDALQQGASDLHVHTGTPLMVRVDGLLRVMTDDVALPSVKAERVIAELVDDEQWSQLATRGQVDFALSMRGVGRLRVNVYRQQRGLDAVFRLIADKPQTLEALGLPARLAKLVDYRTGLVLCTGPAGCGKSSTLAALLGALVQERAEHIITIEDPVELLLPPGKSLVNQRQIRDHTQSFARALRAALREDPDVIAITELRDRETISLALSAAETGHLVLGTLQTGSAAQTISRIVGSFGPEEREQMRVMLAESLRAVVSQRLVPKAGGVGRVPAIELLMVNTAVGNLIRDDKVFQLASVMQTGKAAGMITLDESLQELLKAGAISADTARKLASKKDRFA